MTHGEYGQRVNDRNQDGFLDTPLRQDGVVRNEWRFIGDRGLRANISVMGVDMERDGGMVPGDIVATPWVATTEIQRAEVNAKVGYVLPGQDGRSWGSQWTASTHRHWHGFGNRSYDGQQNTFRANVLRSGFLGSEDRQFSAGVSYLYDDFLERGTWGAAPTEVECEPGVWARTEHVPGAFLETTWTGNPRGMVVAGLRVDQHNLWGTIVTPRLHARWSATEQTSLKMVAGTGFRTPNVLMEELGVWASNRRWIVDGPLQPERGWNVGFNVTSKFKLLYRDADFRAGRVLDGIPKPRGRRPRRRRPRSARFTTSATGNVAFVDGPSRAWLVGAPTLGHAPGIPLRPCDHRTGRCCCSWNDNRSLRAPTSRIHAMELQFQAQRPRRVDGRLDCAVGGTATDSAPRRVV